MPTPQQIATAKRRYEQIDMQRMRDANTQGHARGKFNELKRNLVDMHQRLLAAQRMRNKRPDNTRLAAYTEDLARTYLDKQAELRELKARIDMFQARIDKAEQLLGRLRPIAFSK